MEEGEEEDLSKLTVAVLRQRLSALGEKTSGRKAELVERLQAKRSVREPAQDEPDVEEGESE